MKKLVLAAALLALGGSASASLFNDKCWTGTVKNSEGQCRAITFEEQLEQKGIKQYKSFREQARDKGIPTTLEERERQLAPLQATPDNNSNVWSLIITYPSVYGPVIKSLQFNTQYECEGARYDIERVLRPGHIPPKAQCVRGNIQIN